MHILRIIEGEMKALLFQGKALIVYGPRQTGKTTAIHHLLESYEGDVLELNGDDASTRDRLVDCPLPKLERMLDGRKILFVDEAQRIPGIGLTIKRVVDRLKGVQVILSGSASFELARQTEESLTGRKFEWTLLPFSFHELTKANTYITEIESLETRLRLGAYPDIVTSCIATEKRLAELSESYLYKDLLTNETIRRSDLLEKILKALSFQCGSEVSFKEIGDLVGAESKTVARYVELLKKVFVIFEVPSYARNLRNELKKSKKFYFYDNGIRNAIIGDLRDLSQRDDVGILWENYLMSERLKWRLTHAPFTRAYFWRTTQQQEIDLVEESAAGLASFEFKWNTRKTPRLTSTFQTAYPKATYRVINPTNYDDFLCEEGT